MYLKYTVPKETYIISSKFINIEYRCEKYDLMLYAQRLCTPKLTVTFSEEVILNLKTLGANMFCHQTVFGPRNCPALFACMMMATPFRLCFSSWFVMNETRKSSLAAERMPCEGRLHQRSTKWSLLSRTSAMSASALVTHDDTSGISVEVPVRALPVNSFRLSPMKSLMMSHALTWHS